MALSPRSFYLVRLLKYASSASLAVASGSYLQRYFVCFITAVMKFRLPNGIIIQIIACEGDNNREANPTRKAILIPFAN